MFLNQIICSSQVQMHQTINLLSKKLFKNTNQTKIKKKECCSAGIDLTIYSEYQFTMDFMVQLLILNRSCKVLCRFLFRHLIYLTFHARNIKRFGEYLNKIIYIVKK